MRDEESSWWNHSESTFPRNTWRVCAVNDGIRRLSLFGSVLREDFGSDSDVDVLVTFEDKVPWSLLDVIAAEQELEELFGRKVDLVEKKCLRNPFRRHSILSTMQVIYGCGRP